METNGIRSNPTLRTREQFRHPDFDQIQEDTMEFCQIPMGFVLDPIGFDVGFMHLGIVRMKHGVV
jgi:hypothetical protein